MIFKNLSEEEMLMLDWAVHNEILRYIRQDISKLSPKQRFKYDNLESLRKKIVIWAEQKAINGAFDKNG